MHQTSRRLPFLRVRSNQPNWHGKTQRIPKIEQRVPYHTDPIRAVLLHAVLRLYWPIG